MEVTYNQIIRLNEVLGKLSEEVLKLLKDDKLKITVKRSFRIKVIKALHIVAEELKPYNLFIQEIYEKYKDGEIVDNKMKIKNEHIEDFEKEVIDLMNEKVEVDIAIKFTDEELEHIPLSFEDDLKLEPLLENAIINHENIK